VVYANNVDLNFWWNSSIEVTVATVITQYLQYNNTIIPSVITRHNNFTTVSTDVITYSFGNYSTRGITTIYTDVDFAYGGNVGLFDIS